jgi:hypothetical protein
VAARSSGGPLDAARARVTLNFHPDRPARDGGPLLASLLRDGVYRSQFATGTSNGGLTAHPGGDRWRWESRMFGAAYDGAPAGHRPVYGALDDALFDPAGVGGSPRFGSAHLRLRPAVLARTTFCYPDSVFEPVSFGTADRFGAIAAVRDHPVDDDPLNHYVEAHVHGPVRLDADVEALVLDPSHRGTAVEEQARALPCRIEWHGGFRLHVAELRRHPDYRGAEYVALGEALAEDGELTPRLIGTAARTNRYDPQSLKRLWHYLARYGQEP